MHLYFRGYELKMTAPEVWYGETDVGEVALYRTTNLGVFSGDSEQDYWQLVLWADPNVDGAIIAVGTMDWTPQEVLEQGEYQLGLLKDVLNSV